MLHVRRYSPPAGCFGIIVSGILLAIGTSLTGAEPPLQTPPASGTGNSLLPVLPNVPTTLNGPPLNDHPSWSEALRAVLLTAIPDHFEDCSQWDKTIEVFDGMNLKQRGLELRVSPRRKKVNHGAWQKYRIELVDPARTLRFVIDQIQPDGRTGAFQFDVDVTTRLRCRFDFEQWVLGVKGLNFTVISEAEIRMIANCHVAIRTEFSSAKKKLFPDLVLDPQVTRLKLLLTGLELKRIGEIRGDLAEGLGDSSRFFLESLIRSQEIRALRKANEALDKKRDGLRIPLSF